MYDAFCTPGRHLDISRAISPDETETDLLPARIADTVLRGLGSPAARPARRPFRAAETRLARRRLARSTATSR